MITIFIFVTLYIILLILAFFLGLTFGPRIDEPSIPRKIKVKKSKKKEETEEVPDSVRIMFENIDNYNGTALGQQDVPDDDEEEW